MRAGRNAELRGKRSGFSLLELLVSMCTALILTSWSMPMVTTSLNTYNLRNNARQIVAQCQNARFQAVAGNTSFRLHVNGSSMELQKFSGGSYTLISSFPLSAGISIASAWTADPVFSPRGTVTPAASITLSNNGGKLSTVSVSVLGRVTLE